MSNWLKLKFLTLQAVCTALLLSGTSAIADSSKVSGTVAFDFNTHFVSYGVDVWGPGSDWKDALFNPLINFDIDLGGGWTTSLGTWWDVNNNVPSAIGGSIQEVDVWAGLGYSSGKWGFSLTYQEWYYAADVERILDFGVSYDGFLSPSVTFHGRVEGNGAQDTGLATVIGISEGIDFDGWSLSFPAAIGLFTTDFQGGQGGFGFFSVGAQASWPINFLGEGYGDWSFNAGLTFYHTDKDVIPGNTDADFITGNFGVSMNF